MDSGEGENGVRIGGVARVTALLNRTYPWFRAGVSDGPNQADSVIAFCTLDGMPGCIGVISIGFATERL